MWRHGSGKATWNSRRGEESLHQRWRVSLCDGTAGRCGGDLRPVCVDIGAGDWPLECDWAHVHGGGLHSRISVLRVSVQYSEANNVFAR